MTDGRDGRRDRRKNPEGPRTRPPHGPGSVIVLAVVGALLVSAAASVVFGGGASEATPHGRLLVALETVAAAQDRHFAAHGRFEGWATRLELDLPEEVEVTMIEGGEDSWEAVARDRGVGLSCTQSGSREGDKTVLERPVCFAPQP